MAATKTNILAIDQGTTSTRAMIVGAEGEIRGVAQKEYLQFFPHSGWVEQDANTIWNDTVSMCRAALENAGASASEIAGIGITNQRETIVLWDRKTGEPLANAIVWQDRRTAEFCQTLKAEGHEADIHAKTGLLLDPYFSATKLRWLLDNIPDARTRAERGELAAGTIDCFLLWKLTGGQVHATDASNAARTLLFNIATQAWDDALLEMFGIPRALLPEVKDNVSEFGATSAELFGASIPIFSMVGDQQSAAIGQACLKPGMWKSTYGTGCFVLMHTGDQQIQSGNKMLSTVGYRMDGTPSYALEGSIFIAGAAVQWLRDKMKLVNKASETSEAAQAVDSNGGVYVVPAFTGLGAPHWDPNARGAILGMTLDSSREHVIRATLESIAYQTADLLSAFSADIMASGASLTAGTLRVDGGMVANDWFCQFLADVLAVPVERPKVIETTAMGAAFLAGLGAGIYQNLSDIEAAWQLDQRFEPNMAASDRDALLTGWQHAVETVKRHG